MRGGTDGNPRSGRSCETPLMTSPTAPPRCHCLVSSGVVLASEAVRGFTSLFQVQFYFQCKTKGINEYSALRTKTWTLKARAAAPRDSHHLSASAFVFSLRLESQAFVMEVHQEVKSFCSSLSSSFRRACQSTITADPHRLGRPPDVRKLLGASSEGVRRWDGIFLLC